VGGPIRRNKTFFFFSYEGVRRTDGRTRIYSYPTPQEVRGDFSAVPGSVLDPVTRTPFAGNIVPASRHDPVGAKLAALFPVPNLSGRANNYIANTSDKISQEAFLPKIDHNFSDHDRVAGRLIVRPATENTGSAVPNRAVDPGVQTRKYKLINVSPSWFHTFGPSLFNEARYTYSHRNGEFPSFEAFGIAWEQADGEDVYQVRAVTQTALERAYNESRPTVIEFDTYRYYGHSVADAKHKGGYRKEEEIENDRRMLAAPEGANYLLLPREVREVFTLAIVWRMADREARNTVTRASFDAVIDQVNAGQFTLSACIGGWLSPLAGARYLASGPNTFDPLTAADFPRVLLGMTLAAVAVPTAATAASA
jgi:hypothetical protein